MKSAHLNNLLILIKEKTSLSAAEKETMLAVLDLIKKEIHQLEFKVDRLNEVKDTLSIMLDESVNELENKSQILTKVNDNLSQALGDVKLYAEEVEKQKKQVEIEKSKSDKLLMDILPQEVVHELKTYGRSYARKYEETSVLFADIVGFSTLATQLQPDELVMHLDDYFRGFDHIIDKYGMEKIKTIGDSYMAVSGLFDRQGNHAVAAIKAAQDAQQFVSSFGTSKKIQGMPEFKFRFGIHSGPLVAGVIGIKKFAFDVWGDTVNMAARMEQHGESGRINISHYTYQLIKDYFNCFSRGMITLKNGRQMEMYFVEGEIDH